ncbi:uracil-DNA glycosylase family protein [Novosphingobium sp. 9U]|uniref:uracil-DNA glycosylase family protein n=1 Tax=Novosphingobium sp. 9U TaxID=2653158 RepID=UPI0012F22D26|nr:uracil-DNA glycosylase family protein [Novosphingobium sp. 9U]VWX52012.1 conserved hypothetical protein [Novosphingobium sp. 9U]
MGIGTNPDYASAIAATLDWWRDAGVDMAFEDAPRSWLPLAEPDHPAPRESRRPAPEPEAPAPPALLPATLEAFHAWWMSAPELDGGRCTGRVPPRGAASPELMIIACAPESADRELLLSGPEGSVLDGFIKACGLSEEQVYRASALPCHAPGTDWSPQANQIISRALIQHIALVRPKRVLVFGFVILPLLGHDSPQVPAVSLSFNHEGATVPLLTVRRVPAAASQPRWKSALWQAWLDWSA